MEIRPILSTIFNWPVFSETCQELLLYNPTRKLDSQNIDINDAGVFLGALGFSDDPLDVLHDETRYIALLKHCVFGFLYTGSSSRIIEVERNCVLNITRTFCPGDTTQAVAIITDNMYHWKMAMICGSQNKEVREFLNRCYQFFDKSVLRHLWSDYKRIDLNDGTFKFKRN